MDEEYESAIMEIDEMPIKNNGCYESSRKKIDKVLRKLKRKRKNTKDKRHTPGLNTLMSAFILFCSFHKKK